jgi:hypothetical protein
MDDGAGRRVFPGSNPGAAIAANPAAPGASLGANSPPPDPLVEWGAPPAPLVDPRRFTEAHWQGLEVIPKTSVVAQALGLPPDLPGVIVDDVTLPADLQGFKAGDVVIQIDRVPTPDLMSFIRAAERVENQQRVDLGVVRDGALQSVVLVALLQKLGTANGETPSMIPPGARMPHPYRGPCTNCHRIGTTGTLAVDQGDLVVTTAPTIRVGAIRPHQDRGPCATCHQIVQ